MPLLPVDTGQVITVATFFRVTSLIGVGRYSEVYAAFDTQSQSDVALKLYTGTDAESHALALSEADVLGRLAALNCEYFPRLRHAVKHRLSNRPHPVLALELGAYYRSDGTRDVIKLQDAIPEGPTDQRAARVDAEFWDGRAAVRWVIHLFQAVRLLHEAGVIHHDIKPSNILIKRTASKTEPVPLLLDFNSTPNGGSSQRGTPRYLPPEFHGRAGASTDDDVWAAALVAWELLFGAGTNPADDLEQGAWIKGTIPPDVVTVLRDALALDLGRRARSADDVIGRLEQALGQSQAASHAPPIGAIEFADALAAQAAIRLVIEDALSPPYLLVVPKDIEDSVHTLLLWLNQEDTQALDLISELVRLGPRAIPACLNQGHKLSPQSPAIGQIVRALTDLAAIDRPLAVKSIELYSTSSNGSVRLLCRRLCESLQVFPTVMLNALHDDLEVLLPEERLELAQLCARFSQNDKAGGTVLKFMCREYLSNPDRYQALKRLASSLEQLRHPKRAEIAEWYGRKEKWKELREYEGVSPADYERVDRGVLELVGDAFASMGDAAFQLVRANRVGRFTDGDPGLPLLRRFVRKLARRYEPAKRWLLDQVDKHPDDFDLVKAAEGLRPRTDVQEDTSVCFDEYMESEDRSAYNALRFSRDPRIFDLVRDQLDRNPSKARFERIVALLKGFENRQRGYVVGCVLGSWALFERYGLNPGIDVLSRYSIHDAQLRQEAVARLNGLLDGPLSDTARKGIERLLA